MTTSTSLGRVVRLAAVASVLLLTLAAIWTPWHIEFALTALLIGFVALVGIDKADRAQDDHRARANEARTVIK
jgi:hypothetical protein